MEVLGLPAMMKYGTPALLFSITILMVWLIVTVKELVRVVADMKANIVWKDTHESDERRNEQAHAGFNQRLGSLEGWRDKHLYSPNRKNGGTHES